MNANLADSGYDAQRVWRDFPILSRQIHGRSLVFLDSAASSQRPASVIAAVDDYESLHHANVHRGVHQLSQEATQMFEQARERVRTFVNAGSTREVIFTRGTTESINLVAQSYGRSRLQRGDEILLTGLEHHANIVPWQLVAEQTGAVVKAVPMDRRGVIDAADVAAHLNERTRIVACAHVSNALGTVLPVREITKLAHARGAVVLIDGAQAVPH
ncbi:MAG TPA: aminotransferase class V-fold PLP-dependent enzyme, partial [Steroidobacteraceae bacterium]|nr:aminotransferase class V-fold PLP-dependent enzyme [Steroidobacteraceae bacterium]